MCLKSLIDFPLGSRVGTCFPPALIRAGGSKGNPMPAEKRLILATPLSTGLSHTKQNRQQGGK